MNARLSSLILFILSLTSAAFAIDCNPAQQAADAASQLVTSRTADLKEAENRLAVFQSAMSLLISQQQKSEDALITSINKNASAFATAQKKCRAKNKKACAKAKLYKATIARLQRRLSLVRSRALPSRAPLKARLTAAELVVKQKQDELAQAVAAREAALEILAQCREEEANEQASSSQQQ